MATWPKSVPDNLRPGLDAVLGYRNRPTSQDVWGAVLEWLEAEGVQPPDEQPHIAQPVIRTP